MHAFDQLSDVGGWQACVHACFYHDPVLPHMRRFIHAYALCIFMHAMLAFSLRIARMRHRMAYTHAPSVSLPAEKNRIRSVLSNAACLRLPAFAATNAYTVHLRISGGFFVLLVHSYLQVSTTVRGVALGTGIHYTRAHEHTPKKNSIANTRT